MFKYFIITVVLVSIGVAPDVYSDTSSQFTLKQYDNEQTEIYLADLRRFIRSMKSVRYQDAGYWKEVDKLWQTFQSRKEKLMSQFTETELEKVQKLEHKYYSLRKKQAKWS